MPLDIQKLKQPTLQQLFEQTGDLRFAVLAIGATPDTPPIWAIGACHIYYVQQSVAVESPAAGRPPSYSVEDGILLDDVADLVVSGLSVTAAVKKITGEGSDGTIFRRLMRTWKRHSHPRLLAPEGAKRGKTNKWLDRAHERQHNRLMAEVWKEAQAEIEAGNLSLDLDPRVEEERYKKAQWFKFPPDLNPQQDAQIRIAPITRRHWVIEAKRVLLRKREGMDGADNPSDDKTP